MYIYFSNENPTPVEVFFDDFRVTHTNSNIVQKDDYYPFGMTFNSYSAPSGVGQKYLYNGNEIMRDHGLEVYDFKSRYYDPVIGRFWSIDVLADHPRQIGMSPYQFSWNNPIRFNDPDGKCPSCLPMLYAAYQGMKAKYSGILSQANAPSQRLISGTSGNTPSNIGMNETVRSAVKITGVASDINAVTDVGKTLAKEATMDVGNALDKGGEIISDVGVALAIPTEGASLVLVPVGEGLSLTGKGMKATVHAINGDNQSLANEAVNAGVGILTNGLSGAAVKQSLKTGNITNTAEGVIQKTVLGGTGSAVNKTVNIVTRQLDEEKKQ
ncbi:RHS repeat domain-containing protein [Belliella kenyensis]|uniref:RHS repeat domain-containing protein n=1 Tax=Belliella kenyensis TaxID=1472724 RepID=A0ABV8EJI5_9BACT|nr:RHS repeat-associated core domain-containing protein [Belliella kenyensis]